MELQIDHLSLELASAMDHLAAGVEMFEQPSMSSTASFSTFTSMVSTPSSKYVATAIP